MKFTGTTFRGTHPLSDAHHAVQFVAEKATGTADGSLERVAARADAMEAMLGRLIGTLIDNGQLRAGQVEAIFDYDVIAEE